MNSALSGIETILGHRFAEPALLAEALTHPSALTRGRSDRASDYERLEFLGDRVLGLVIAEQIYLGYTGANAGRLALRYNEMVRKETLAEIAVEIGLPDHIRMSDSERASGGLAKPAILADICEAVIGALFIDGGLEAAQRFILPVWKDRIAGLKKAPQDAKTALQEWAHAQGQEPPTYEVIAREGPDHAPSFTIRAALHAGSAEASGPSKKETERRAAKALLEKVTGKDG
ncbi:ribonuclease III [Minwuia sp.]|uniref:ribonuclease III n=1 Tax=Minwuia sp. TaxID=2493630 RepID=UPI003A8FC7FE